MVGEQLHVLRTTYHTWTRQGLAEAHRHMTQMWSLRGTAEDLRPETPGLLSRAPVYTWQEAAAARLHSCTVAATTVAEACDMLYPVNPQTPSGSCYSPQRSVLSALAESTARVGARRSDGESKTRSLT